MLQAATASDSGRLTTLQPYKYQDVSFAAKDSTGCFRFASLPEASEVPCSSGTSDFLDQASYGALDPYQGYQLSSGYSYNQDPFTTDCSGSAEAVRHVRAGYDFTSGAVGPPFQNRAQNLDNRTQSGGVATDRGQATFPSPPGGSPPAGSMYVTMTTHASYSTCATSAATSNNSDGSPPSDPYSNVMVWLNHQACGGTVKRKRKINKIQRSAANIRERRRMIHLNVAFERLREQIPMFPYEKKPSRIRTLKMAIDYIAFMTELLHGKDNVLTKDRPSDIECSPAKSLPDW